MPHRCLDIWGGAADRLERALADRTAFRAAPALASEAGYRALCAALVDLSAALGVTCPPPPPWRGGGGEPPDLRGAALALCGGLATDRADPAGQHDPAGGAWLATGAGDAATVAAGRRLLMSLEGAFTRP